MLKNKRVLMAISLLISICLWLYVMGNVDPVTKATINMVHVEMTGEDYLESVGLEASLQSPKIIEVVIEGKRSEVNEAKKKGIVAKVDVSHCDYGKNLGDIVVQMPDGVSGVTVYSMSENKASFVIK